MCTAISLNGKKHLFGRNLDLDLTYGEKVAVMPRGYTFPFKNAKKTYTPYAVIGMAAVVEQGENDKGGIPLFFDGMNECGLAGAGLNFPENAHYVPPYSVGEDFYAVAPFELLSWVLCRCKDLTEAKMLLNKTRIVDIPFSSEIPNTPLHWIFSDKSGDITVEQTREGLNVYDNPVGVLTNNPPLRYQLENLEKYSYLGTDNRTRADFKMRKGTEEGVRFYEERGYSSRSNGMGAVGLPGDVSSKGRFVRAAFARENSSAYDGENGEISQFFHLLDFVQVVKGLCKTDGGRDHFTQYSCCMDTEMGVYFYTTYQNRRISCIDLHRCELDGERTVAFELLKEENIFNQN